MTQSKKGMLAAAAAYSIFGLSFLFSKKALNIASPMILLCARFTVTFLVLNLMALTRVVRLNLKGKSLAGPICLGVLQPVLYFVFENYGLKYTTTSFTGMMSAVNPVFAAILGAIFLKERPAPRQWACILVSILGVMIVSTGSSSGQNTWLGCLCLVLAYLSGSGYSLVSRRMADRFTPFELTYVMFAVGFVFFLGGAWVQHGGEMPALLLSALQEADFVTAVLFLSLASSVGAFMLINYALARLPVARAAIFANITTVVSVLAGVIVMGDPFSPLSAAAFGLILIGVWGVNRYAVQ
ncbi:MAG: DMT family transporter [Clostridia bacterium]|nr:DMT family transporter [Clostridia bacterium]